MSPTATREALIRFALDVLQTIEDNGPPSVARSADQWGTTFEAARRRQLIERGGLFGAGLTMTADVLGVAQQLAEVDE